MPFTITHDTKVHFDCQPNSVALVQSVDDKAVFVGDANAHHSEWF